jgi:hypothetical protein
MFLNNVTKFRITKKQSPGTRPGDGATSDHGIATILYVA